MQISQSLPTSSDVIREVPSRLLSALADGERIEATVVAKMKAGLVSIRLADTVIQIRSSQPLEVGQKLELVRETEAGKPVLRLLSAAPLTTELQLPPALKQGQIVAIEVLQLLAQKRLLVTPQLLNTGVVSKGTLLTAAETALAHLPKAIEVDVSKLRKTFQVGDKLSLQVITEQPLTIRLQSGNLSRAAFIQQQQYALLPKLDNTKAPLTQLSQANNHPFLASQVRTELSQLLNTISEKQGVQQPDTLKQALSNSGHFLESHLKNADGKQIQQDFKANLLKLAAAVQTQLQQPALKQGDIEGLIKSLPRELQTTFRQLVAAPEQLRTLPPLIQSTLATKGQTPTQLILTVLTSLAGGREFSSATTSTLQPTLPVMNSGKLNTDTATLQSASRFVESRVLMDLLREIESVVTRLQFNQLSMIKDPDTPSNVNVWLFDLPVKERQQLDMMQVRIEQHLPEQADKDEAIWQIQLNLETENLGPMQAKVSLYQADVKVVLFAELEQSAVLLNQNLTRLEQRLTGLGLNVSHLACRHAPVTDIAMPVQTQAGSDFIVDISV